MWWLMGLIAVGVAVGLALSGLRTPTFEVGPQGLRIGNSVFAKTIPLDQLDVSQARVADLARSPDLRPKWRTMGIGWPGHQSGWYRLQNGEKALVFLQNDSQALYLPTKDGSSVLIGDKDPSRLLSSLLAVAH